MVARGQLWVRTAAALAAPGPCGRLLATDFQKKGADSLCVPHVWTAYSQRLADDR
jgi:hypothetical protein